MSLVAQKNLDVQQAKSDQAMERISSGLRINHASDDAAGSAIASKMESQVRSLGVAIRNGHDAISMTQTAEGALGEMENILQRVRELAVQAGNSTLSASDRSAIQSEITALTAEIDDIASSTHFNDVKILDGSVNSLDFQIGINAGDGLNVVLQNSSADSLGLNSGVGVSNLYTSERMTSAKVDGSTNPAVSDIKINGQNFASDVIGDLSASSEAAGKVAEAINKNTSVHGAVANAFNTFTSNIIGGDFKVTMTNNGVSSSVYDIQLRLYRDDVNGFVNMPASVTIGIYQLGTNNLQTLKTLYLNGGSASLVPLGDPCYTPNPSIVRIEQRVYN